MKHFGRSSAASIEGTQWNIELLEAPTEEDSDKPTEWSKPSGPLCPCFQVVVGSLLIEAPHIGLYTIRFEVRAGKIIKTLEEAAGRPLASNGQSIGLGPALEEVAPYPCWIANGAIEPRCIREGDPSSGGLDPLLRTPIGESTSIVTKPKNFHAI